MADFSTPMPAAAPGGDAGGQGAQQPAGQGKAEAPGGSAVGKGAAAQKVDMAPPGVKPTEKPGQKPAAGAEKPQATPDKPAPQKPAPEKTEGWPRKVEFKIEGERIVEEFESEEHFRNEMQRRTAEAMRLRKQQNQIQRMMKELEAAKADPLKAIKALNPDFDLDQYAIQRATEMMELEQMDPRERELLQHKQKIEEYERQAKERQEAEETQKSEQLRNAHRQRLEKTMLSAIEELGGGMDKDYAAAVLMPDIASVMLQAQQFNPTGDPELDLTPKEIAAAVKKQHAKTSQRVIERMPEEAFAKTIAPRLAKMDGPALVKHLGADVVAKIVSAHMQETTPRTAAVTPAAPLTTETTAETTWDDEARRSQMGIRSRRPPRL